jgi:uncharacterized protein with GYD domain
VPVADQPEPPYVVVLLAQVPGGERVRIELTVRLRLSDRPAPQARRCPLVIAQTANPDIFSSTIARFPLPVYFPLCTLEGQMPKYLVVASYTAEGARGVLKDGGTKRRQAAEAALKSVGGKLEQFYFAFGENDAYVLIDAPDNVSVAAASLVISASGAVSTKTIVLLTPEEVDQAIKKNPTYQPPGR